jgi:hypothetical protein
VNSSAGIYLVSQLKSNLSYQQQTYKCECTTSVIQRMTTMNVYTSSAVTSTASLRVTSSPTYKGSTPGGTTKVTTSRTASKQSSSPVTTVTTAWRTTTPKPMRNVVALTGLLTLPDTNDCAQTLNVSGSYDSSYDTPYCSPKFLPSNNSINMTAPADVLTITYTSYANATSTGVFLLYLKPNGRFVIPCRLRLSVFIELVCRQLYVLTYL